MTNTDNKWMQHALELARQAAAQGEVPVGAVLVRDEKNIGEGFNQPIKLSDCTAHAEIQALRDAGQKNQDYRFPNSTLYCTLEPCAMCAGAIVHARVTRLVFAASDPKVGAAGSVLDLTDMPEFNHRVLLSSGLMEDEAAALLIKFFKAKR